MSANVIDLEYERHAARMREADAKIAAYARRAGALMAMSLMMDCAEKTGDTELQDAALRLALMASKRIDEITQEVKS